MIKLTGKKVLITGGSRGIGKAAAIMFAQAGADIAFTYQKNQDQAGKVLEEINQLRRTGLALQGDVASFEDVKNNVDQVIHQFGRIDILVNNAGIWEYGAVHEMSPEQWL